MSGPDWVPRNLWGQEAGFRWVGEGRRCEEMSVLRRRQNHTALRHSLGGTVRETFCTKQLAEPSVGLLAFMK